MDTKWLIRRGDNGKRNKSTPPACLEKDYKDIIFQMLFEPWIKKMYTTEFQVEGK